MSIAAPLHALTVEAYQRAERLQGHHRAELALRCSIREYALSDGERFAYAVDTEAGTEWFVVDARAGTRLPAFDDRRLAAALGDAAGREVTVGRWPFDRLDVVDGELELPAFGTHWRASLDTYDCREVERPAHPEAWEVRSPDGCTAAFVRAHDLWIRDVTSGAERRLTHDGEPRRPYGAHASAWSWRTRRRRYGIPALRPAVSWSPDSTRLLTHRVDEREVAEIHLVESAPGDDRGRPRLHGYPYAMPGDSAVPTARFVVLDVRDGRAVEAEGPPYVLTYLPPVLTGHAWWGTRDGRPCVWTLGLTRHRRTVTLSRIDPDSGVVTTVLEESSPTHVDTASELAARPVTRVLRDGRDVLWYSERDGWGHLYLHDAATGELRRRLTDGPWGVEQVLCVDEDAGVVHFVAYGLAAEDPYRRTLCRVTLDRPKVEVLIDDRLDHALRLAPIAGGVYFIDSASTVDTPPWITLRDLSGDVALELEHGDVTRLAEAGWSPPERFRVKAADGVTDVYGVIYRPHGFDPDASYPVVDHLYPGPQMKRVQPSFDQGLHGYEAEAVAALGFVVIAMDGRGTPGRGREFLDVSYGRLGCAGSIEDHVAALDELGSRRPWMDLDRVGAFGLSGGGFATVRAMALFPEVFRVGVAESGNHDDAFYQAMWGEMYEGPWDPERYARSSNLEVADRIEGRLLLIHGELDDNVPPFLTMKLVDRLIEHDKDFEMLLVPGADHVFAGYEHYVIRRRWDFLVRHLLGIEPPAYRLARLPNAPERITGLFADTRHNGSFTTSEPARGNA